MGVRQRTQIGERTRKIQAKPVADSAAGFVLYSHGPFVPEKKLANMGKIPAIVRHAFLVAMLLAAAAVPQPARALVVPDTASDTCSTPDQTAIVRMPCAQRPAQIQTMRFTLMKSLVPMHCRAVGIRFHVAGLSVSPGRGAGLIASALFSRSPHAQVERLCEPTRW